VCVTVAVMVMLLRDFGRYGISMTCVIIFDTGNAVKGFLALLDNLYDYL
jgi:hypothetical protein